MCCHHFFICLLPHLLLFSILDRFPPINISFILPSVPYLLCVCDFHFYSILWLPSLAAQYLQYLFFAWLAGSSNPSSLPSLLVLSIPFAFLPLRFLHIPSFSLFSLVRFLSPFTCFSYKFAIRHLNVSPCKSSLFPLFPAPCPKQVASLENIKEKLLIFSW